MQAPETTERIPQPSEWETVDDVLVWTKYQADAGNLYIYNDLRRVLSTPKEPDDA